MPRRRPWRRGTVAELFERWFDQNEPGWSPRTGYGYRLLLRRHGGEGGKPLSAASVKRIHGLMHVALKQGVRWGWIASNPADNANPPRAARHEITLAEPADVVRVVEASATVNYALPYFFRLAAVTGARRGELCALRWRHVDFGRRQLAIARALVQLPGQVIEKGTKTHQSRRSGHANAATTLGIYAHFMDAADHQAAEMMGNLLDGGGAAERSPQTDG